MANSAAASFVAVSPSNNNAVSNGGFESIADALRSTSVGVPNMEAPQFGVLKPWHFFLGAGVGVGAAGIAYKMGVLNPVQAAVAAGAVVVTAFAIPIAKGFKEKRAIEGEVVQAYTEGRWFIGIVESYSALTPGGSAAVRLLVIDELSDKAVYVTLAKEKTRLWDTAGNVCDKRWFSNRTGDPSRKIVAKILTAKFRGL